MDVIKLTYSYLRNSGSIDWLLKLFKYKSDLGTSNQVLGHPFLLESTLANPGRPIFSGLGNLLASLPCATSVNTV